MDIRMDKMDTVTHLAGPSVGVSGRVLQRCVVCGEKLCDNLRVLVMLNPDGTVPEFPTWENGTLVRFTCGNPRSETEVGHWDTHDLPPDFCLPLVE